MRERLQGPYDVTYTLFTHSSGAKVYLHEGGSLNPAIVGTSEGDNLAGTSGQDYIYGEAGDDTLNGGAGDDLLHGGSGSDILLGYDDDDLLIYNGDGTDTYDGGLGTDTLEFQNGGTIALPDLDHVFNDLEVLDFTNGDWSVSIDADFVGSVTDVDNTLYIMGDLDDALFNFDQIWIDDDSTQNVDLDGNGTQEYNSYRHIGTGYTIYVDSDIDVSNLNAQGQLS